MDEILARAGIFHAVEPDVASALTIRMHKVDFPANRHDDKAAHNRKTLFAIAPRSSGSHYRLGCLPALSEVDGDSANWSRWGVRFSGCRRHRSWLGAGSPALSAAGGCRGAGRP